MHGAPSRLLQLYEFIMPTCNWIDTCPDIKVNVQENIVCW